MRRLILISLAAGALGACATTERVGAEMTWSLYEDPSEGAKLVLGVPDSDNVRLMMVCRPHSGAIDATVVGHVGDPAAVEFRSGKVSHVYAGAGQPDEETDGAVDIQLKMSAADPVMARLADTGELTLVFPTRRIVLPNAFADAHDFLKRCRPQV